MSVIIPNYVKLLWSFEPLPKYDEQFFFQNVGRGPFKKLICNNYIGKEAYFASPCRICQRSVKPLLKYADLSFS